jgi:hypothetical protein
MGYGAAHKNTRSEHAYPGVYNADAIWRGRGFLCLRLGRRSGRRRSGAANRLPREA